MIRIRELAEWTDSRPLFCWRPSGGSRIRGPRGAGARPRARTGRPPPARSRVASAAATAAVLCVPVWGAPRLRAKGRAGPAGAGPPGPVGAVEGVLGVLAAFPLGRGLDAAAHPARFGKPSSWRPSSGLNGRTSVRRPGRVWRGGGGEGRRSDVAGVDDARIAGAVRQVSVRASRTPGGARRFGGAHRRAAPAVGGRDLLAPPPLATCTRAWFRGKVTAARLPGLLET